MPDGLPEAETILTAHFQLSYILKPWAECLLAAIPLEVDPFLFAEEGEAEESTTLSHVCAVTHSLNHLLLRCLGQILGRTQPRCACHAVV